MYTEYIVRFVVILSRGTEVRGEQRSLSFCPFARMRIARSAELAIDSLTRATRAFERIDVSESSYHEHPPLSYSRVSFPSLPSFPSPPLPPVIHL